MEPVIKCHLEDVARISRKTVKLEIHPNVPKVNLTTLEKVDDVQNTCCVST